MPLGQSEKDISSVEALRCVKLINKINHHIVSVTLDNDVNKGDVIGNCNGDKTVS